MALFTVNDVAAVAPKLTAVAPVKPVPVITTVVPPLVGPAVGAIEVITGAATKVNWSAELVLLVPPAVVTRTSTVPALPTGETAVICVALFTVKDVAAVAPKLTAVAPLKPVPVITTVFPPTVGPEVGANEATAGAAA